MSWSQVKVVVMTTRSVPNAGRILRWLMGRLLDRVGEEGGGLAKCAKRCPFVGAPLRRVALPAAHLALRGQLVQCGRFAFPPAPVPGRSAASEPAAAIPLPC